MIELRHLPFVALTALAIAGCSPDRILEERTNTIIGSAGGRALSADGKAVLDIPAGALSEDVEITIDTDRTYDFGDFRSHRYEFGPDGLTFSTGIELTISAPTSDEVLAIANVDDALPQFLESSRYDAPLRRAVARLDHFSSYCLFAIGRGPVTISTTNVDFGTVDVGRTATATVILTNGLPQDFTVLTASITPGDFSTSLTTPQVVTATNAHDFNVAFAPSQIGSATAFLDIVTDAGVNFRVNLSGVGAVSQVAQVVASPGSVDFGEVFVGRSATVAVTLMNTGTAPATINNVVIPNAGPFQASLIAPHTLQPGASVSFPVAFTPTQLGSATAVVEVTTSVASTPLRIPLSGTGRTTRLSATPSMVDFGIVGFGMSSTRSVLITNIGFMDSAIVSYVVVPVRPTAPPGPFSATGPLGVLRPGDAAQFDVTFVATASTSTASWSAVLEVTANNDFLSIPLSAWSN